MNTGWHTLGIPKIIPRIIAGVLSKYIVSGGVGIKIDITKIGGGAVSCTGNSNILDIALDRAIPNKKELTRPKKKPPQAAEEIENQICVCQKMKKGKKKSS